MIQSPKLAVIGLGYVGLPLAVAFAKKYLVVGFDINRERVKELNAGHDNTMEVGREELLSTLDATKHQAHLCCTDNIEEIKNCKIFIVTVPTPIDFSTNPDLGPLLKATESVARVLKKGDIVIYESTVYPGATEEECVPVLERISGLEANNDFAYGYSPERINPGDKEHTFTRITKVVSGSTPEALDNIDELYKSVVTAGTYRASSVRVAEAAKVIENTQRDINIAFVNELAIIFNKLGIDTEEVLQAAGTKWNFLPFRPGLVGGHCIGVDPYYLAQKAQSVGYYPQMILSGRRLNNGMGSYIAKQFIKLLIHHDHTIKGTSVLMLGITFKENCPDIRNSKVVTIINELKDYNLNVDVCDPWADPEEVRSEFGIELKSMESIDFKNYGGVILAVSHEEFREIIPDNNHNNMVLFDVKSFLPKKRVTARL